ncbi:MAG TPA: acyltransferase [Candidatus Limnocylindria bacterium]|jgi:peptidoglycan/LPS O-acetylase OafA/YrhL|nr:acyltransferase [Candidatus Limnocylindria bacterium]
MSTTDGNPGATPKSDGAPLAAGRFPTFPQLDGFRGLAVLLVLVEHTLHHSVQKFGFWDHFGNLGVILFFGLSGFLITGLLAAEWERKQKIDLPAFYMRRGLRIIPALYALLAVMVILKLIHAVTDVGWVGFAEAGIFVRNLFGSDTSLSHLWSVSIEMQYYLFWPWVFVLFGVRGAWRVGWGLLLAVVLWRTFAIVIMRHPVIDPTLYLRTDYRLDAILAGSLLALSWRKGQASWWQASDAKGWRWIDPIWLLPLLMWWSYRGLDLPVIGSQWITGQVLLAAVLLARCLRFESSWFSRICRTAGLRALGRWSYSIYLWQQIFLVVQTPNWGWIRLFPVNLVFVMGAALLSHYLVEQPCLRLKSAWRR